MKKTLLLLLITMIFFSLTTRINFPAAEEKSEKAIIKKLSEKYRKWFELVTYIITKAEKSTFLKLTNDRDRDVFINLFWNLRDPTPDTEVNEFMQEHIRRFQYANKYFKFGSPRQGWKTDMGKIYIILGEPASKDKYEMDNVVVPSQIWSYYGQKRAGLPNSFLVVFFKKDEMGEYRMYNPASDGPNSLLRKTHSSADVDPTNYEENFNKIDEEHPLLAKASLSLIPNENPYDFSPTLRSQQLIGQIIQHPKKQINDNYATNFLKYKGQVDVDYSMNYIEARHKVVVYKNLETGLNLINFAIRPNNISAATAGEPGSFSFNFIMTVSLKKGDLSIFEYRKKFPFSGSKEDLLAKFSNSLIFSDCFPAPAGEYKLSVLLQNQVNKEFTYFDADISGKPLNSPLPVISGPVITKVINQINRQVLIPFKFGDMEVNPDPRQVFGTEDKIFVVFGIDPGSYTKNFDVVLEVQNLVDPGKYKKSYPVQFAAGRGSQFFKRELEKMAAGYYNVRVRLLAAGGALLSEKQDEFTIAISKHAAGTSNIYRATSLENKFLYYHILGLQYMRLNKLERAETYLERAFNMRPTYPVFIKDYARLLLKMEKPVKVIEIAAGLNSVEKYRFDYYSLTGKALFQQKEYKKAIEILRKANEIYDSDISVLNVLGFAYLSTGNKEEARKIFSASLKINEQQKNIAKILQELK